MIQTMNRLLFVMFPGGLPRAWSTPSLGPFVRTGLKPPLLQQAAFDDLVFKVDVMRNVASRHFQNQEDELTSRSFQNGKWNSLPALNVLKRTGRKENENDLQNKDEGLQEVGAYFFYLVLFILDMA